MTNSMLSAYNDALSRGLIGKLQLNVDFQREPWDTNCFMAIFYLEFTDLYRGAGDKDWLYLAAFVAHPAHSSAFTKAVAHGKTIPSSARVQNIEAAINFIQNDEVNCVYSDADMLAAVVKENPAMAPAVKEEQDRSLLPKSVIPVRDLIMEEIISGCDYWRRIWRPKIGRIALGGPSWFS